MNNYNQYREHRESMLPTARTPVSNRNDFARASIPAGSTTARSSRMCGFFCWISEFINL
jgi:hypothetical protein